MIKKIIHLISRFLAAYREIVCSNWQWYRIKKGGAWYKIRDGGLDSWTHDPENFEIMETENHPIRIPLKKS